MEALLFLGIIYSWFTVLCDAITCRYSLMADCWTSKPELRPPFAELVIRLSSQLLAIADYMDFSSAPDAEN